jgi:hypothetical protein
MTTTELIQRVETAAKELAIRKNTLAYKSAIEAVTNPNTPVVCGENTGSGRHASSHRWDYVVSDLLKKADIPHTCTNVAKHGGRAGARVTVTL